MTILMDKDDSLMYEVELLTYVLRLLCIFTCLNQIFGYH